MGIEIPEALQWAAKYVVGAGDWPEGDETAMRRMADAYTAAATTLDDLGDDAQRQVNQLLAALDGQSADAIEAFWKKLGNDDGALSALTGLLKDQADVVDDGANDIEHTKLMIIAQLVIFAVEMAAALAAMATGVGAPAGAAAGAAARVATQITIRMLMKQLLQRIVTRVVKEAALGALEEGGLDLGIRLIQAAKGDRELSRDDFTAVWQSAAGGAIGGAISGGLGREGGLTNGVGDAAGEGLGNAVGNRAKQFATDYTTEVASDIGSQAAMAAITGEEFELSADTFTSAAAGAAQNQFDRGGDDGGDSGDGNDSESGNDDSGNDDSGRGDNDGDRGSDDDDRGSNQNPANNNAGNEGDRGGDNPSGNNNRSGDNTSGNTDSSNQPNHTSPANADDSGNNEPPARTQPASADNPTSTGNDGPRTTDNPTSTNDHGGDNPNSNNARGGENTPGNNDTGNQPNNTNPANASSNDDSGNANANNNEPPARTQTDGDPTNSGNNPTGTGENPPTNRVAANEPEAAPANAENNDSGNEPPARTQPDGDQTNTAANNNPAQTSPGSDSNTPNSTGNPDAGGDHPPSQQPSPTSNDSSGDHGSGATNPPADQPRSTTDEPGNTASGNDKSPTAQPTQTAPTAPATQQSRPGDHTQDAPVGSLDLPAQDSPTTSPQQSPSPLDLPAQDPTPTQDPSPLDLPPQDTPPAHSPRPLDLPPQEAPSEQPPSPLDLPDPNTQADTEPQSATGAPLTTAPSNTTAAAATPTAPPLDAGTQPNSPAASAPTSTTPTPPQGPTPTTQPSPTPQPNGPTPARPTPPRSNNAGTQTNSSPTAATTTPSPDQERDQSPELPIRPGYDPTIHKYVAHFNDGRPIPRDPFFAGEYNPHIGRYQPTEAEFQAERAHLAANPPAPQNTPRTDPGHHSPDVPNQQPADPTRDETLDSSPATTPSPHDTTPTAGAPHVNDTTPTNTTPPNTTPANTDLHDFTNLEAHRARTQLPSWWPSPARDQANNSPAPSPSTTSQHHPNPTFPDARAPESTPPSSPTRNDSSAIQGHPHSTTPSRSDLATPPPTTTPQSTAPQGTAQGPDRRRDPGASNPGRTHNPIFNTPGTHPHSPPHRPHPQTPPPNNLPRQTPADQARAARQFYRNQPPVDGRVTRVPSNHTGRPAYEIRRHRLPSGEHVSVLSVRVHLAQGQNVAPSDLQRLMRNTEYAIDHSFNTAPQLLGGDRLLVDVEFTSNPADAHIQAGTRRGIGDFTNWSVDSSPAHLTDNLRLHLGFTPSMTDDAGFNPDELRVLSNGIAAANTDTPFSNPSETRVESEQRLAPVEDPSYQEDVEDALRNGNEFTVGADPRNHPYGRLINDGGPTVIGRSNNCLDCSLSALSSFYGNPQVSAPRWPDELPDGTIDRRSGEDGGPTRAAGWLNSSWNYHSGTGAPIADQFAQLHNQVAAMGPGSSALVINEWATGGSHATVIVYPPGASGPVWWDPQSGATSDTPPAWMTDNSTRLWSIPISPDQGANNAGSAIPHQGASGAVPGAGLPEPGTDPSGDGVRMGGPSGPEPGTGSERSGSGPRELRGEQADRGDNSAPESASEPDRGGVRPSDQDRPTNSGVPGVPTDVAGPDRTDSGNPGGDRVPRPSQLSDPTPSGTPDRSPTGDQQTNPRDPNQHPSDPPNGSARDSMDSSPQPPERDLASDRDVRVLEGASSPATDAQDFQGPAPTEHNTTSGPKPAESPTNSASAEAARPRLSHTTPAQSTPPVTDVSPSRDRVEGRLTDAPGRVERGESTRRADESTPRRETDSKRPSQSAPASSPNSRGSASPHHNRPSRDPQRSSAPEFTNHSARGTHPHPQSPRPQSDTPPLNNPPHQTPTDLARVARQFCRNQSPIDGRVTAIPSEHTGRPAYEVRRHRLPSGEHVAVATVRVHLVQGTDVTPGDLQRLMANTEQAVDHSFNTTPQLLGGDRLLIDVQFTSDPANAHIQAGTRQGIGDLHTWSVNNTPVNVADNIRLQLGLYPGRDTLEGFSSEELRQLTNEIARARSRFDFDSPADMRISGPAELRPVEQPSYQHDVEDALRTGSDFAVGADPRTHPYGRLINDGGTSVQGRSNNCMDCSLSALSSFYGNPQVSAPRFPDITEDGTIDDSDGERSGDQRARAWLGSNWQRFDRNMSIADQAAAMHDYIARMGPGSSALVGNDWHSRDEDGNFEYDENGNPVDDGGHVTVIVYPYGADGPVWWDPQTGETSDGPPAELTNESYLIEFIPIGPGGPNHAGTAIDTGTSTPASSPSTGDKSGVLSSPDRVRMGMPSDSDTGGTGDGQRTRTGELRGQSSDRSDNSTSEPFRDEDRESVRRSDPDGPASTGSPGIPAHLAGTDRPDAGNLGRHPVPGSNRVPDASAGDSADGAPAHDRQTYIPPSHGQPDNPSRVHPGDGMGSSSESAERDLAAQRDLRVLDVSEFAHDNESAQSGPDSASQHDADQDKSDVATEQHAPLLDVKGYIAEPQVVEALDRADALGTTATVDGVEMPVSEAVRRLLPQHPELARLMQEADYLENSLLSRPRTLVSLMNHPEAIHVLEDAVHEVRDRGPEEVIAESESATGPDSTPLTPDQRAISDGLQAATRDFEDEDLRQPGFDRDQINDTAYVSEYLDRQYAQWRSTQDALNDVVRQVAQETSGDPGWRNEPKDRVRAEDKISGYGNDASKLTDLVGAKIVFDTVSDIYRAAELLANDERIEIVDFEDRFAEPVGSGYRDLQMKVRMPNGHIAELRLHLSHIDDVASYEHSLYEARRDLKSLARADGRDLTPSEAALMASLERRSVEMFQTALERGL